MTKVENKKIRCIKCGHESKQMVVYSINYNLGSKEENQKLMNHKQKCPNCGYEAKDISKKNSLFSKLFKKFDK